jgi:6-phosphogluconolactonase
MKGAARPCKAVSVGAFVVLLVFAFAGHAFGNKEPKFAYVANGGSNNVSVYTIDSTTGALTPVGSPVAAGLVPASVAVDPSGKFAYVANQNSHNVSAYTINSSTGALTPVGSPVAAGFFPVSVAVDPSGKFAYVANDCGNVSCSASTGNVSAYTINPTSGALTAVGSPVAAGTFPVSVAVDPSGKFAYVANGCDVSCSVNGNVSAYTIGVTGALTPVVGSPFPAGSNPNSVAVDPSGKFAYVVNQCVSNVSCSNGNVSAYIINSSTGALTLVGTFAAGSGPVSVAVDPTGKFAYVANINSNNVSAYAINPTTAALSLVDSPVAAGTFPVSVAVDPSGKFGYVANFCSINVSAYIINSSTGALTLVGTFAAGSGPRSVAVAGASCVPFAAHRFTVEIDLHSPSQFDIHGSFKLGATSDGINPLTEAVTLTLGTYSVSIPPGAFRKDGRGFEYHGVINGAFLEMEITPLGHNRFLFEAEGRNANLTGTTNPVELDLSIGDDCGTTQVHARFRR